MADIAARAGPSTPVKHSQRGNGSGQDGSQEPSTVYKVIMTPINFASFILSLVLVDMQYSLRRLHNHAEAPSRLPSWLHTLLFCPQPYQPAHAIDRGASSKWYYHSNQRRIMEMEAEDAFRMRNMVLIVFGLAVVGTGCAAWFLTVSIYRYWFV